jgi:hypothetical protein
LLLVAVGAFPASAQALVDAFTVKGVDVDVTASSPAAAKDEAIATGQRIAFQQLLERLTSPADHARLPNADALNFVRDYGIESERSSAVRYLATLTVRFNPAAVRKLLKDAGIAFTDARSRPVVVVPVLQSPGRAAVLWDDPNPWRTAWAGLGGGGLVPLVVPVGELADLQALSAEQALAGDAERLTAEGARWRTSDVMVAAGTLAADGRRLDVALSGLPGTPLPFPSVAYDIRPGESPEQMMARAARDLARALDLGYKQANLLQFDHADTLSALVPLSGLDEWLAVRERLSHVSLVRSTEVVSLSRTEAAVVLHVVGDPERVKGALANAGLALDLSDGLWTMRVAARK